MKMWRDIKVEAISLNVQRKETGMTVSEMLEKVRVLIAANGYKACGPTQVAEGYQFRMAEGANCLTYLPEQNIWE